MSRSMEVPIFMEYLKLDMNGNFRTGFGVGKIERVRTEEATDLMNYCEEVAFNLKDALEIENIDDPNDYLEYFKDAKLFRDLTGYHFFLKKAENSAGDIKK